MKNKNIFKTLLLLVGVLFIYSCTDIETFPETRLFRPVLNHDLSTINNTIVVDMAKMKSAVYYKIEVSRDTFKTILKSIDTPDNKYVVPDLLWNTLYQVRATAIAESPEFDSKISILGAIKTTRFPSILQIPTSADMTDISVKIRWTVVAGQEVTTVKVFAATDEALLTPLASYPTTPAEILAGAKIISGLTPGTKYQFAIYSGSSIKGWDFYTTKPAIPTTGNVIDLRGKTDPDLLMTTLKDPATISGSTIILDGDMTYNASGYSFDKSITIKSGYSINSTGAKISVTKEFNFVANTSIASIVFDGVTVFQPIATPTTTPTAYFFSPTVSYNVVLLKFVNCKISDFRGVYRSRAGISGSLSNYVIDNCIVSNIRDYGVVLNEATTGMVFENILFSNSTFYKCQKFILSSSTLPSKSITITDCTLNEETAVGNKIISYPAANNVTDGVIIKNTIIGRAWDMAGTATTYGIDPIDGLTSTNFTVSNSYATVDYTLTATGTPIPTFPNSTYSKTMKDLWKDTANGDFNFIDSSFQGVKTSGDPRWRLK